MATIPSYPYDLFTDKVLLDPHPYYQELRELGPVVWLEAHDLFVLPRYAEVRAALGNAATFLSGHGVGLNDTINNISAGANLLSTDGELHDHLRGIVAQGLTPRALRAMRTTITTLATDLVADLVARGSFDAVTDLARVLPLSVVPDLVGWPTGGRKHLLEWAGATFDLLGPMNARAEAAIPNVQTMLGFANHIAVDGDVMPGSLAATVLAAAHNGQLQPAQVPPLIVAYIAPALDTTISAIGGAVRLLATHPAQWSALKTDPALIPNAFNEIVRLETPIRAFSRVAATDTTVAGCDLAAGSRVVMLYASANRDERQFPRPTEFDITRSNAAEHVGFGYGVHGCAGQGLARLESHAVLTALLNQVDSIELGEPQRGINNLLSAWASLPVTVTVRPTHALAPIE